MGKVIYDMSISLDGFITAAHVRQDAGLGDDGEQLHDWGFNSSDPRNKKIAEAWIDMGAMIFGRITFDLAIQYWGADGPTGSARVPIIVVSHSVPHDLPDDNVYIFVHSVEEAFKEAKKAAGSKDIGLQGGNIAEQFIKQGFVDELFVHVVPVLFGSGKRMIEDLSGKHIKLELIETIPTKEATHLRFRVIKDSLA